MPPNTPLLHMIFEIFGHTPMWVWGVLAALLVLGSYQLRERSLPRLRVALIPLGMGIYSLWGAVSLFGLHTGVLGAWMLGAAGAATLSRRWAWAPGVQYAAVSDRFTVPGTPWPLLLMISVFAMRYAVVVTLMLHRDAAGDATLAAMASAGYGILSGLLAGRAMHILGHGPDVSAADDAGAAAPTSRSVFGGEPADGLSQSQRPA